jgi:hypothetical protein
MKTYITLITLLLTLLLISFVGCEHMKVPTPKINAEKDSKRVSVPKQLCDVKPLEGGWVEAVGRADITNITPEEAKRKAIMNACVNAIQFNGFEVSQRTLDIQSESNHKIIQNDFLSLTSLTTKGIILEKELIDDEIISDGKHLEQMVRMRIRLGMQQGRKDPYFKVHASLNKDTFKVGDTLQLTISSTQDCYITILNIADETAYVLFPNMYCSDTFLKKGQRIVFPNKNDTKMGMSIPALLPPGKDLELGVVKILATKKETSLESLCTQSQYGTYQLELHDLMNFFIQIPRDEIEEADFTYRITK